MERMNMKKYIVNIGSSVHDVQVQVLSSAYKNETPFGPRDQRGVFLHDKKFIALHIFAQGSLPRQVYTAEEGRW